MKKPYRHIRRRPARPASRLTLSYVTVGAVAFLLGSTLGIPGQPTSNRHVMKEDSLTRVTGIGGVFFKSNDPDAIRDWYRTHLGIDAEDWGGFAFQWVEKDRPGETGYTVWGPFADKTTYFDPSEQRYMLNYRVADLTALIDVLREEGVEIVGEIEQHPNGKFAWIMDPEGQKIELWEPVPSSEDPYLE